MNNKQKVRKVYTAISISLMIFTLNNSYAKSVSAQNSSNAAMVSQAEFAETNVTEAVKPSEMADQGAAIDTEVTPDIEFNKDPYERINRAMFMFNDKLDIYIVKPIAILYNAIMPKPLNYGIHNFFNNLGEIPTIANDILQFNFFQMTNDVWRFLINSTLGLGGFFDLATRMNLPYFQNDFGLTLARWGYEDSNYLVLPFFGSNTIRDGVIGLTVDYFEFSVYPYIHPQARRYGVLALLFVDHRANLLQFDSLFEEAAIDKYVFMRNAYMQHRYFQIDQVKHLGYSERTANSIKN